MIAMKHRAIANLRTGAAGFSLIELLVSMGVTVVIMGTVMQTMSSAIRANQQTLLMTGMNANLRTGMDLMTRDLLQTGQGMPSGGVILIPSGAGSSQIKLPGPPGTNYRSVVGDLDMSGVTPGPGLGPVINGVATDMITVLEADSAFDHKSLSALAANGSSMTVSRPQPDGSTCDISNGGPDDVLPGQLILLTKGSAAALVEVTSVNGDQTAFFATGDSLNLNQPAAAAGNITALLATAPPDVLCTANCQPALPATQYLPTQATRIRMISYYLDATTVPTRPRLVRRMNNGNPLVFDNTLGNVVAFDVEGMLITYDINDGATNPSGVRFNAADLAGTGSCSPNPCNMNQIRKVNATVTGRSPIVSQTSGQFFRNSLSTEVALRSLAFVDRYRG
jgi:type II secretory pathway pseudopilin PulG